MMLVRSPDVEFGPWNVDDVVTGPVVISYVDEDGTPVSLSGVSVIDSILTAPDGTTRSCASTIVGDAVEIVLPAVVFDKPGIWYLEPKLRLDDDTFIPEALRFVVEERDGWLTIAGARAGWRDAPRNDVALFRLLEVARSQVIAWAPVPASGPVVPSTNLVTAQGMQTRNLWNAAKTDPASQGIGDEGFVIRPYPLDPVIKDIIRPKRPKPVVA